MHPPLRKLAVEGAIPGSTAKGTAAQQEKHTPKLGRSPQAGWLSRRSYQPPVAQAEPGRVHGHCGDQQPLVLEPRNVPFILDHGGQARRVFNVDCKVSRVQTLPPGDAATTAPPSP